MAHPRRIVPGDTYLITRRCCQRTFRLRPSVETNRIFMYCLAVAMKKTGVLLHAACVMSNHHHLVVTDPRGVLPDFLREFHRLTAKAMNASQGQWENLWAAEPCNIVRLVTDDDVDDKIGYVVANPVIAGLVQHPEEWPGFLAWGEAIFVVTRPASYFREHGRCPERIALSITKPLPRPIPARTQAGWIQRTERAIAGYVSKAHRAMTAARRVFLGRDAVLGASFIRRARSHEHKWSIVPTFAAKLRDVRDRLRRTERQFRVRYRQALTAWRAGQRDVIFPFGTWGMRVFHAANVEVPAAA